MTASDVSALVHTAAHELGLTLRRGEGDAIVELARRESGFDPNCRTGSHYGLWQIAVKLHGLKWPMTRLEQAMWVIPYCRSKKFGRRIEVWYSRGNYDRRRSF